MQGETNVIVSDGEKGESGHTCLPTLPPPLGDSCTLLARPAPTGLYVTVPQSSALTALMAI